MGCPSFRPVVYPTIRATTITSQVIETVLDTRYPSSPMPRTRCLWHGPEAGQGGERKETMTRREYEYGFANCCGEYPDLQYEHVCAPSPPGALRRRPLEAPQRAMQPHGLVTLAPDPRGRRHSLPHQRQAPGLGGWAMA